jgi:hypothetical protein
MQDRQMFETEAKRKAKKELAVKEGLREGLFLRVMDEERVAGELWSFEV